MIMIEYEKAKSRYNNDSQFQNKLTYIFGIIM